MNRMPDEQKQGGGAQTDGALSDSKLEQVSGGAYQGRDIWDIQPEIEYGEP